jgi:hypothetical protein
MTSDTGNPRRRPKGDKRARTRAKLLEAARALTRQKGYEHTATSEIGTNSSSLCRKLTGLRSSLRSGWAQTSQKSCAPSPRRPSRRCRIDAPWLSAS